MNSRDMLGGNFKCVGRFGDVAATNKTRYPEFILVVSKFASAVTSGGSITALSTVAGAEAFLYFSFSLPSRQSRTLAVDRPERLWTLVEAARLRHCKYYPAAVMLSSSAAALTRCASGQHPTAPSTVEMTTEAETLEFFFFWLVT